MTHTIDDILGDFELLDDWEDRYRYVIELGRGLDPLPDEARTDEYKVRGCASQVWLKTHVDSNANGQAPRLRFMGDSDAHIVRGLIAILFALYSGQRADEILARDPEDAFMRMGLKDHLTPQRSNGLASMVARIRDDARQALEAASAVH